MLQAGRIQQAAIKNSSFAYGHVTLTIACGNRADKHLLFERRILNSQLRPELNRFRSFVAQTRLIDTSRGSSIPKALSSAPNLWVVCTQCVGLLHPMQASSAPNKAVVCIQCAGRLHKICVTSKSNARVICTYRASWLREDPCRTSKNVSHTYSDQYEDGHSRAIVLDHVTEGRSLHSETKLLVSILLTAEEKKARQVYELNREKDRWNQPGGSSERDPVLEDYTRILVTLTYFRRKRPRAVRNDRVTSMFPTRFLCCPLNLPVRVMKKFILKKFDLPLHWDIDVWRTDESLLDDLTLDDIVRIYGIFRERKPLEISFSVTPKDAEVFQGDSITLNKTVQFDLKKESNAASTIAARNILTTTPDPSDDEDGKDSKEKQTKDDNVMDVDKEENDGANSGLNSSSLAEVHVTS
eukprot:gene14800-5905_t